MGKRGRTRLKTTMSLAEFHAIEEQRASERKKIELEKEVADLAEQQKVAASQELQRREEHDGFLIAVKLSSLPKVELPATIQLAALEFGRLALHNLPTFASCSTLVQFEKLFLPFYMKYIQAPNNFQSELKLPPTKESIALFVREYAAKRKDKTFLRLYHQEQCWRFLSTVSVYKCLQALETVLQWVTVNYNQTLVWHVTHEQLIKTTHTDYTFHGYFHLLEAKQKSMDAKISAWIDDW